MNVTNGLWRKGADTPQLLLFLHPLDTYITFRWKSETSEMYSHMEIGCFHQISLLVNELEFYKIHSVLVFQCPIIECT